MLVSSFLNGLPQGMRKVTLVEDMSDLGNMSWLKAVKVPTGNNYDENQVKILGLYPMKQEPPRPSIGNPRRSRRWRMSTQNMRKEPPLFANQAPNLKKLKYIPQLHFTKQFIIAIT